MLSGSLMPICVSCFLISINWMAIILQMTFAKLIFLNEEYLILMVIFLRWLRYPNLVSLLRVIPTINMLVICRLYVFSYSVSIHWFACHDDVIKWKHFPRNWPFVREIHRSPVNFQHKGQWRGALMFSLIYAWINDWVNNREAGDLRRQHGYYDVIVM